MNLHSAQLEAFYACAQARHFTRAAERLHITQSALSQRIANLESDLGVTLILRDPGGLRLTEAGEELLRYCQVKNQLESQVLDRLRGKAERSSFSGTIRVGGFSSVMRSVILPSLQTILRAHPRLRIKLVTRELAELPALLRSGEVDFLVLDEPLSEDLYVSLNLGIEQNVMVCKKGAAPSEVFLDHDESDRTTLRYLQRKNLSTLSRHYLDDVYGIIDAVEMGLGTAVVPKHLIFDNNKLTLVQPDRVLKVPVILHYHRQPFYSDLHQAIVKALKENSEHLLRC